MIFVYGTSARRNFGAAELQKLSPQNPSPTQRDSLVSELLPSHPSLRPSFVPSEQKWNPAECGTANLRTNIMDFRGFDSSTIFSLRDGILMSIGDFPESLSQAILVGIMLVRRLGVGRLPRADTRTHAGGQP